MINRSFCPKSVRWLNDAFVVQGIRNGSIGKDQGVRRDFGGKG